MLDLLFKINAVLSTLKIFSNIYIFIGYIRRSQLVELQGSWCVTFDLIMNLKIPRMWESQIWFIPRKKYLFFPIYPKVYKKQCQTHYPSLVCGFLKINNNKNNTMSHNLSQISNKIIVEHFQSQVQDQNNKLGLIIKKKKKKSIIVR